MPESLRAMSRAHAYSHYLVLGALPAVLLSFSVLVQPALIPRYAISALLAFAPLTAIAVSEVGAPLGLGAMIVFLGIASDGLRRMADTAERTARQVNAQATLLSTPRLTTAEIVVSDRHVYYPLAHVSQPVADRMRFPTVPSAAVRARYPVDSDSGYWGNVFLLEQDVSLVQSELYGVPRFVPISELRSAKRLLLVGAQTKRFAEVWLPDYRLVDRGAQVFEAVRDPD